MYNVHNESFVMGTKNPDVYWATNYKHMIHIYIYIFRPSCIDDHSQYLRYRHRRDQNMIIDFPRCKDHVRLILQQ